MGCGSRNEGRRLTSMKKQKTIVLDEARAGKASYRIAAPFVQCHRRKDVDGLGQNSVRISIVHRSLRESCQSLAIDHQNAWSVRYFKLDIERLLFLCQTGLRNCAGHRDRFAFAVHRLFRII